MADIKIGSSLNNLGSGTGIAFPPYGLRSLLPGSGIIITNLGNEIEITALGFSSFSGYSGYSGYSGATGTSGLSGYSGPTGVSGYSGYSGVDVTGISGFSGFSGPTGVSGFSGFSGPTGVSGFSGETGTSGFSGFSGPTGISGFSGFSGPTGISGFSGFSGDPGPTGTYVLRAGDTMTGPLTMSGSTAINTAFISGTSGLQVSTFNGRIDIISPSGLYITDGTGTTNVNYRILMASGQTTNASNYTLQTIPIESGSSYLMEARIIGIRQSGSGTNGDSATYVRTAKLKNPTGATAVLTTLQTSYTAEDITTWNGTIVASGPDAIVRVVGAVGTTINWNTTTILQRIY